MVDDNLRSKHSRIPWLTTEDCQRIANDPVMGKYFKKPGFVTVCLQIAYDIYGSVIIIRVRAS